MAHVSGLKVHHVMAEFVSQVQNSGMHLAGIRMSCPKHDRNDNGPKRIPDRDIKQAIAAVRNIVEKQVTKEQIQEYSNGLSLALTDTQDYVEGMCINSFGVGPVAHLRSNSRAADPPPYRTMSATRSPGGVVEADGHKLADIPDPEATSTHYGGGNYASASGSRHAGSSSGPTGHSSYSARPSGQSSSSSRPSGTPSSTRPSGYSSLSTKPSGYPSSSARPSGTSSARPSGGSSSSSGGHRTTTTTSSSGHVPPKSSSTSARR